MYQGGAAHEDNIGLRKIPGKFSGERSSSLLGRSSNTHKLRANLFLLQNLYKKGNDLLWICFYFSLAAANFKGIYIPAAGFRWGLYQARN